MTKKEKNKKIIKAVTEGVVGVIILTASMSGLLFHLDSTYLAIALLVIIVVVDVIYVVQTVSDFYEENPEYPKEKQFCMHQDKYGRSEIRRLGDGQYRCKGCGKEFDITNNPDL